MFFWLEIPIKYIYMLQRYNCANQGTVSGDQSEGNNQSGDGSMIDKN